MEDSTREEDLFAAALSLPASERERYLARACEDAPSLLARLTSLIRVVDSTISSKSHQLMAAPEAVGDQINNYRLLREIGEGGCGVVYLAEQIAPVRREVALKIIRLGMDGQGVIAHFEAERQVLALMDHPNIAKVLDAGATAGGRPYFVMELVRGIKITDYCDQVRSTVNERVELFMQVCLAIQHAHHKGIIHRDIKPSNVLVTLVDGAPVAKVIDFGIAKATQGRLTEETLLTAMEQFLGTPAYVSPEQTEAGSVRVDTRSDVYSLGVLLYELLTHCRPFDSDRTSSTELASLRERIRTVEPIRPSICVANHDRLAEIATLYRVSAKELIQRVRGDLDWIILCCLEKEQVHRYQTANALWNDLRQHLGHWPIAARPRGTLYTFGKFARRHRVAFTTMMIISIVLAGSAVSTAYMAVQMTTARRLSGESTVLLQSAMSQGEPIELTDGAIRVGPAPSELARNLFEAGKAVRVRLADDPFSEAAIRETFGSAYASLRLHHDAQLQFEQALQMYRLARGDEDSHSLAAAGALARSLSWQGQYEEAGAVAADALATVSKSRGLLYSTRWAFATSLAFYYYKQDRFMTSKALLEPYVVHWENRIGEIDLEALETRATHAPMYPPDVLESEYERVDLATLEMMAILAPIYASEGRTERALELARTIVAVRRLLIGTGNWQTAQSLRLLADVYLVAGEFALASDALVDAATSLRELRTFDWDPDWGMPATLAVCASVSPRSDPSRPTLAEYRMSKSEFEDQSKRVVYPQTGVPQGCLWTVGRVSTELVRHGVSN
jgi:eukaryotic-like serine/threonine-protein kinase